MQTIKVEKAWTYRTPETTVEYSAGEHEVTESIAKAYADEHEEKADDGPSAPRAPRAAAKA